MTIRESTLSAVRDRLISAKATAKDELTSILREYAGISSVVEYTPESWGSLIGLARLSGFTSEQLEQELGVSPKEVAAWIDGKLPERRELVTMTVEFITAQTLFP